MYQSEELLEISQINKSHGDILEHRIKRAESSRPTSGLCSLPRALLTRFATTLALSKLSLEKQND